MWRLVFFIAILTAGCTVPAQVFFRNFSNGNVRLQCTLVDRKRFDKLPNKVGLYDTSLQQRQICGNWKSSALVSWVDTTTFYIDVAPFMVVDIEDISNKLVLGASHPDVLLLLISKERIDTLTTGDYWSLAAKFKSTGYSYFKTPKYYYDFR